MAKNYKIKHYHTKRDSGTYKARPHPLSIILTALLLGGLVFLGISIYEPVYKFIMEYTPNLRQTQSESEAPVSQPESSADESEPEPEVRTGQTVFPLRAVYLPHAIAADNTRLDAFLDGLSGGEVNAVMVDIKDKQGSVLFHTQNPQAVKWEAVAQNALDLSGISAKLAEKNLQLIVRANAFNDSLAAKAGRENAIYYQNSEWLWLDEAAEKGGKPWLNPYAAGSQEYISSLALEAVEAGAVLVVLEGVQFPPGSGTNATFGAEAAGVSRQQVLRGFLEELSANLAEKNARLSAYVSTTILTQQAEMELYYGGNPVVGFNSDIALGALPYQFGTGFSAAGLEITQPIQNPGAAVKAAVEFAQLQQKLSSASPTAAGLIPLIQGGNESTVNAAAPYTRTEVDEQIAAVKELGLEEYILFCTDGKYL